MSSDRWAPEATTLTRDFWDATRRRQYLLQWCDDCDSPIYYPRCACPQCLGANLSWRPSAGAGAVHSFTVVRVPSDPWTVGRTPYVVALVDLEEGARILTNLVVDDVEAVRVGLPVRLSWEPLPDGRALPLFAPLRQTG